MVRLRRNGDCVGFCHDEAIPEATRPQSACQGHRGTGNARRRTRNPEGRRITEAGGSKGRVATRLDKTFRDLGWREGRHDTTVRSVVRVMPYKKAGEKYPIVKETEVYNEGYKVDNVKGRVALDVEWNAKDGNLDRDISQFRALYEGGIIDAAVIITRTQDDLRALGVSLGAVKVLDTSTTTNLGKLEPRLTRGDSGGCPVLAVAISAACYVPESN